jgi:hypothetical protein
MSSDLAGLQRRFARRLLRPEPARDRRMAVYRNNVAASLVGVLRAHFPVVGRIVGADFFEAAAVAFVRAAPPASPVLAKYGGGFADFLEGFAPAADLPYLPDVARLEWARNVAHHAADADSVGIDRLAAVPADRMGAVQLLLHPAAAVVASPWPVVSIWETNALDAEARRIGPEAPGETALVTRPDLEVLVRPLPACGDVFVASLRRYALLSDASAAAEAVAAPVAPFDLAATLAALFGAGAVACLLETESP